MAQENSKIILDQTQPLYVGMDVHKNKWSVCIIHQGVIIEKHTIPGEYHALKSILQKFKDLKIYSVYEAGFSGFWLHDYLTADSIINIVVPSNKIPTEVNNLVKTDRKDAEKLAFTLSKGLLRGVDIPPKNLINLRQILRTREKITRSKRTVINRIKMLLLQFDIKCSSRSFTKDQIRNIKQYDLPEYIKTSLEMFVDELELFEKQVTKLQSIAHKAAETSEYSQSYKILRTVPGLGPITAATICFEVGDFKRFSSAEKLSSYLGLTPREYSSGEHVLRGRITGQGKPWVRSYLIEAAWYLIAKDPAVKEFYNRIKFNSGSGKKAIVAVARKLVHRIHSIVINNQCYSLGIIA